MIGNSISGAFNGFAKAVSTPQSSAQPATPVHVQPILLKPITLQGQAPLAGMTM
jgi:hypothetical protein